MPAHFYTQTATVVIVILTNMAKVNHQAVPALYSPIQFFIEEVCLCIYYKTYSN